MIGIVDHGTGNLLSVFNAFEMAGADVKLCLCPDELADVERIVLPGVGAFSDCMENLHKKNFVPALEHAVFEKKLPIMGICLGMQVMADRGFEGGEHLGLGWIPGKVVRMTPDNPQLRVPHIGWNDVQYGNNSPLFSGLRKSPDFYFVHSYHYICESKVDVDATCEYGGVVTVALRKNNIFATQFHPEKSQDPGLRVIENFLDWEP